MGLFIKGMASSNIPMPYHCKLLLVGHSYIRRLERYCRRRGIVNFGLPSYFLLEAFTLPGARLSDLVDLIQPIVTFSPDLIVMDIGGNDMSIRSVDPQASAMALIFFLRYLAYILRCRKGYYPVITILEQHYRSRAPRHALRPQIINQRLAHWHYLLGTWAAQYQDISFVRLHNLNMAGWMAELVDGVHLTATAMFEYLRTVQHAVLSAEQTLNCEYIFHFFTDAEKSPKST